MKIEKESYETFRDTAAAIWRFNEIAQRKYPTPKDLCKWMIEETLETAKSPDVQGWGTLGFYIAISKHSAHAAVESWFVLSLKTAERP